MCLTPLVASIFIAWGQGNGERPDFSRSRPRQPAMQLTRRKNMCSHFSQMPKIRPNGLLPTQSLLNPQMAIAG
jgi:hypothetical protein